MVAEIVRATPQLIRHLVKKLQSLQVQLMDLILYE